MPLRRPRVLLVKVPCYSDVIAPPLGLGYLAAHLQPHCEVLLLDGLRSRLSLRSLAGVVRSWEPDVVGFSAVSHAAPQLTAFARATKRARPQTLVVAGGPHPAALPDAVLDEADGAVDVVMTGQAEREFVALVLAHADDPSDDESIRRLPGVVMGPADARTRTVPLLADHADDYGMPAWSLMEPRSYPHAPHGAFFRRFPVAPILTSRGCPYSCGFCSVPNIVSQRMRYRSAELVCDELALLRDRHGVAEFQIVDDNFTVSRDHAIRTCEQILERGLAMPWTCPNGVRIDALDDEVLDAMQAAGCYSISLGIESGSPAVLRRMVKHLDLSVVADTVDRIVARGMEAHAFFILGYPGEEDADREETLRLAKALPLTRANFSLFSPLPGTPEFDHLTASERDRVLNTGDYAQVSYIPPGQTAASMKAAQRRALLGFYLRRHQLRRLLGSVRTPSTAWFLARRSVHWLGARA